MSDRHILQVLQHSLVPRIRRLSLRDPRLRLAATAGRRDWAAPAGRLRWTPGSDPDSRLRRVGPDALVGESWRDPATQLEVRGGQDKRIYIRSLPLSKTHTSHRILTPIGCRNEFLGEAAASAHNVPPPNSVPHVSGIIWHVSQHPSNETSSGIIGDDDSHDAIEAPPQKNI